MPTEIFPGDFKSLASISEFVIHEAAKVNFTHRQIYAIQTAVDEACSNIIDHAYGGENLGFIEITIQNIDSGIKITIIDDGNPFNPEKVPYPDLNSPLDERPERGLGVFFIKKFMDEVVYDFSNPQHNKLVLKKNFSSDP